MANALKNVTITLPSETVARARVQAAERSMSLSRFVGEVLHAHLGAKDEYEASMRRFFAAKPFPLKGPPQRYPAREELYDRPVLRRR